MAALITGYIVQRLKNNKWETIQDFETEDPVRRGKPAVFTTYRRALEESNLYERPTQVVSVQLTPDHKMKVGKTWTTVSVIKR